MTLTLTRRDAWAVRRTEQDRLAAMRVERRLVYALHGEDGHDRAVELDYLMKVCVERIDKYSNDITDWTGACLEGESCTP